MAETAVAAELLTADDLLAMPHDGRRRELVAGRVVEMAPAGFDHEALALEVGAALANWARATAAGRAVASSAGFVVSRAPDTVRAPDGAYIAADRLPRRGATGFCEVIPDLVFEVVSPGDRPGEVMAKAAEWLAVGVKVVWVFWPAEQVVQVWRTVTDIQRLVAGDVLTCDDLLPGFALPLALVFA